MSTPEGKVKAGINRVLAEFGDDIYRYMPVPYGYGQSSLDYLLSVGGIFVAIEAKAEGEDPTARQEITIKDMRRSGAIVFVVDGTSRTMTYEELRRKLKSIVEYSKALDLGL